MRANYARLDTAPDSGLQFRLMTDLLMELLVWVAERPRTYGETMEAWRTSCPRMPVWEDATAAGLIEVVPSHGLRPTEFAVRLTRSGREAFVAARQPS